MKSDLVVVNSELGLIDHDYKCKRDGIPVKRLSKGYTSEFDSFNVHYVDLKVKDESNKITNVQQAMKMYKEVEKFRSSINLSFDDVIIILHLHYAVVTFSIYKGVNDDDRRVSYDGFDAIIDGNLTNQEIMTALSKINAFMKEQ